MCYTSLSKYRTLTLSRQNNLSYGEEFLDVTIRQNPTDYAESTIILHATSKSCGKWEIKFTNNASRKEVVIPGIIKLKAKRQIKFANAEPVASRWTFSCFGGNKQAHDDENLNLERSRQPQLPGKAVVEPMGESVKPTGKKKTEKENENLMLSRYLLHAIFDLERRPDAYLQFKLDELFSPQLIYFSDRHPKSQKYVRLFTPTSPNQYALAYTRAKVIFNNEAESATINISGDETVYLDYGRLGSQFPLLAYQKIMDALGQDDIARKEFRCTEVDHANMPKITFSFDSIHYYYSSENYIVKKLDDPATCVLAIIPYEKGKQSEWTLGATFAKAYPTKIRTYSEERGRLEVQFCKDVAS
uniref:AlNc14C776G12494 protein n=1 Tax=Albugo laibachii Nc14 TaxID=890382 RepID=F0X208_9STRA|nr:AlNc14C776G12494 [Albugo laibachii Nc14]|eukprot:CCA27868.1 AlNc14C776G12494 [Albugo laibachii Nc14]